ncbi:phosphatase PAP2 family protein [Jiangella sp. DSM 45060]|uniref:phosphatase PAP2 family protein n=1 Tax=Jiangella sp. DSM 45060 TaxID=1798224 RepID=UPI00087B16D4|nr:phosphatase PAP2 family protein [Jiangella sp. DSM 45060]SDT64335.1 PAP2 superfamily protein [Jiangella sp. DSM 45060]
MVTDDAQTRVSTRREWPWWAPSVAAGLVSAALLGLMTWLVLERTWFIGWDWDFHVYVDARQPGGFTKSLLDTVARFGGQRLYTLPIIAAVGLFVAYKQRSIRVLIAIASGLATVLLIGYWIKFGLGRTPPASGQDVLHGVGQAFPSGHTANATLTWFLLVVVLFGANGLKPDPVRFRRYLWVAGTLVVVTGFLMTALDYHWVSDIPGGMALGLLALMISVTVLRAPPLRLPRRRG